MVWQRALPLAQDLELDPRYVELVEFDLSVGDRLAGVLSVEELARAERFAQDVHRARFVCARGVLRLVLGQLLRVAPAEVGIRAGRNGKPELASHHASRVHFNLSHSEDRAVVALCVSREVGVDVERVRRDVDTSEIALRFFAAGESAALLATPEADRRAAFFRCWTGKESYLKARGDGLLARLDAFEVEPAARPVRLRWSSLAAGDVTRWSMASFDLDADHVAALTVEGTPSAIHRWSLQPCELERRAIVT